MERLHIMPQNIVKENSVEQRGKRAKFWFRFLNQNDDLWLFKKNIFNEDSLEDYGEILYQAVCKQLNLPCAEYELVSMDQENGETLYGVISKNYNPKKCVEISGATLLTNYRNFVYDNENGREVGVKNTIENYEKALQHFATQANFIISEDCPFLLKVLCLLDYLTGQSDRHAYNITFILNQDGELTLAPFYDNGNAFLFNRAEKYLHSFIQELYGKNDPDKLINKRFKEKAPMLGVKTSTVDDEFEEEKGVWNMYPKKDTLSIFEQELAQMIADEPKLLSFFINNLCNANVIENACQEVGFENALHMRTVAEFIFNQRLNRMRTLLKLANNEKSVAEEEWTK